MKTQKLSLISLALLVVLSTSFASDNPKFKSCRLIGPRLGMTYILPGGKYGEELKKRGIENVISQFGWHHEWLISPEMGGPSFVIQLIGMLGGVEYGTVIPSASLVMGIRLPHGFEFGMGPNVVFTDTKSQPVHTALILAVGKSLDFNGVSIPLNLAWQRNNEGNRISFVFGYAITHRD